MKFKISKHTNVAVIAVMCAFTLVFSGCSAMFNKEYRSETKYEDENSTLKDDSSIQEVKNYVGMRNAVLNLVNNGSEYGIIRTSKYSGSAEDDISKACFEVTRESPMGIYAVDYMTHSITRILSYDEIEIYITYKRSQEEISSVVTIRSGNEAFKLIDDALADFKNTLTIMQVSTSITEDEIKNYINDCYRSNPQNMPEKPDVTVNIYASSEDNIQKITEIQMSYSVGKEELSSRSAALRTYAYSFFSSSNYGDIRYICSGVQQRSTPAESGNTAYDAVFGNRSADSEGYAMMVKMLCATSGIECYVVEGRLNNMPHYWNIINNNGNYCHVDVYEDDLNNNYLTFKYDNEMWGTYWWDTSLYPECKKPSY